MRISGSVCTLLAITCFAAPTPLSGQAEANQVVAPTLFADLEYRMVGPTRGGRVTAVHGVPQQPGTYYSGATGGGVWKTTDYGQSWHPISDGFFETGSIGAIDVNESNPDILYVGTGSQGIRSNVILGRGIYKSTDAGSTWRHVGLRNMGQLGAVESHPNNPDIVYVAALGSPFGHGPDRGVYRTRDGGATWQKVLFVSDSTGFVDLAVNPSNPDELYAAAWRAQRTPWTIISGAHEGGIYKSTDGGDSWTKLSMGLPQGLIGKIGLDISRSMPNRVWALIEAPGEEGGLYRSDDAGATWTQTANRPTQMINRPFYYTRITADPVDANTIYINNEPFFRSTDGGVTFTRVATPHTDNHDLWIDPNDPRVMIQANDGGVNVSRDGAATWSTQLNQATAELYSVEVDSRFPYWLYSGQQDNSTIGVPSLPPASWTPDVDAALWDQLGGCETGPVVPKPGDPNVLYTNCKGQFGVYDRRSGQERSYWVGAQYIYGHNPTDLKFRLQRVTPIAVSPHDPNTVYYGSQFLHRTRDGGVNWETISPDLTWNPPHAQVVSGSPITRDITGEEFYSVVYAIAESPRQAGVIWVGSNDGLVHVTRDGGANWTNVTPQGLPEGGRVQTVEPSPHDPARAYVAIYRYLLDDWQPYIYRTTDYGATWTRLTTGANGIPADYPTRVVREDPERAGLLYAGTEFGMFVSFDDGAHWQSLQLNLPVTPVTDLKVVRGDLAMSTMGRGFWILDDIAPLRQANAQLAATAHLYTPQPAWRMRYDDNDGDSSENEYIEPGATIDFVLPAAPRDEAALEIVDERGALVRRISSNAADAADIALQNGRAPALEGVGTERLPAAAGHNRFIWDLSLPGAWSPQLRAAGANGPMALPGDYQVRLIVDGRTAATQPLRLRVDPRVEESGVTLADLQAQMELALRVRDLLTAARVASAQLDSALVRARASNNTAEITRLETLRSRMENEGGLVRYPQQMLASQIQYLYGLVTRADQRPGRDAFERYEELLRELEVWVNDVRGTTTTEEDEL